MPQGLFSKLVAASVDVVPTRSTTIEFVFVLLGSGELEMNASGMELFSHLPATDLRSDGMEDAGLVLLTQLPMLARLPVSAILDNMMPTRMLVLVVPSNAVTEKPMITTQEDVLATPTSEDMVANADLAQPVQAPTTEKNAYALPPTPTILRPMSVPLTAPMVKSGIIMVASAQLKLSHGMEAADNAQPAQTLTDRLASV